MVGGGDWGEDRLVPDLVRALAAKQPVALRHPAAVRPWQHVLEPLAGDPMLAERLVSRPGSAPTAVNFGPDAESFVTVAELVGILDDAFGGGAGWRPAPGDHPPEAAVLTLDSSLAKSSLGWWPRLSMRRPSAGRPNGPGAWLDGDDVRRITGEQIDAYQSRCRAETPP